MNNKDTQFLREAYGSMAKTPDIDDIIDWSTIEVDGIDKRDYPDFSDAYVTYAKFKTGKPLSDLQLDQLNNNYWDQIYNHIMDNHLYENNTNIKEENNRESIIAGLTKQILDVTEEAPRIARDLGQKYSQDLIEIALMKALEYYKGN